MNIIKEPDGVDFVVEQVKLTKADKSMISLFFQHYKETGEILKAKSTKRTNTIKNKKITTKQ